MPLQLWKQRKNSKHSHKTSCYWLIIGKLHTSHGKFHDDEIPGSFFLGGIWGNYPKSCTSPWGSSIRFYWEAPWIFILGMHTSCSVGRLNNGWKSRELPRRHLWNWTTCTMDEKLGATLKVACKELAQWMKNWMKMDETSLFNYSRFTFANPSIIQLFDHFKMFLHKFELGIWRRWLSKKKVQTNKMRISILTLGEIFPCHCLLNWANAIFIPSLLLPTFYPYHQCNI